jgi:hypothetical protein
MTELFASAHVSHHHEDGAGWPCPETVDTDGRVRGRCVAPELFTERKAS